MEVRPTALPSLLNPNPWPLFCSALFSALWAASFALCTVHRCGLLLQMSHVSVFRVCVRVCLLATTLSLAKTDERIENAVRRGRCREARRPKEPLWPTTRWFIITGTPTKSEISLLLGHTCGYNLAWSQGMVKPECETVLNLSTLNRPTLTYLRTY